MTRKIMALCVLILLFVATSYADARLADARQFFAAGNYKKAAKSAEEALKEYPGNIEAGLLLASSYSELEKYKKAVRAYKDVIAQSPENTEAMFGLGFVYNKSEYPRNAVDVFRQLVIIEPENKLARYWLGSSLALCMDLDKAYNEYRILKKMDPVLADDLLKKIYSNY